MSASPFHVGEQWVQQRVGVREAIEPWARQIIRPYLPEQHRDFYAQLPFVVAAARDAAGRPWVTLLTGAPGFAQAPDQHQLWLATQPSKGDALAGALNPGTVLGLLGIELATRRRNRVNGVITGSGPNGLHLAVRQSFGNCPQYITEREWRWVDVDPQAASWSRHDSLDDSMKAWISQADTMFIGSGFPGDGVSAEETVGMDASHRGGERGFVQVLDAQRLVFPDYAGNNHFNTIGNLLIDPRVGLLFIDFARGNLLQITGRARIDWDSDAVSRYPGAQRLVYIDIEAVVQQQSVLPLRWGEPGADVQSLSVARKVRESADVVSLLLAARDGCALPDFEAGQHLPIELHVNGWDRRVSRTYSLSNVPGEGHYRISVKREPDGLASRWLHDAVSEGDVITAKPPAGDFVLRCTASPTVLISAGIGITPMVSMLHQFVARCGDQPLVFVHGARNGAHHALAEEVRRVAAANPNIALHVAYSRPRAEDIPGRDYHHEGHITPVLLASLLPHANAEVYLCGPAGFMADVAGALRDLGVAPERINSESFGPSVR